VKYGRNFSICDSPAVSAGGVADWQVGQVIVGLSGVRRTA
jgi:hypothetical protein